MVNSKSQSGGKRTAVADEELAHFTIGDCEPAAIHRIPDPPPGMFTDAEWQEILRRRAEREAAGTTCVGD